MYAVDAPTPNQPVSTRVGDEPARLHYGLESLDVSSPFSNVLGGRQPGCENYESLAQRKHVQ